MVCLVNGAKAYESSFEGANIDEEMEDWLKEVHNDVKEGKNMAMIYEMTDMGEKVCGK